MANSRLAVDRVRLQKSGAELIKHNEIFKRKLLQKPGKKTKRPKRF